MEKKGTPEDRYRRDHHPRLPAARCWPPRSRSPRAAGRPRCTATRPRSSTASKPGRAGDLHRETRRVVAGPGSVTHIPGGTPHNVRNESDSTRPRLSGLCPRNRVRGVRPRGRGRPAERDRPTLWRTASNSRSVASVVAHLAEQLVGRTRSCGARTALDAGRERSDRGRARIGKTRLLAELEAMADARGTSCCRAARPSSSATCRSGSSSTRSTSTCAGCRRRCWSRSARARPRPEPRAPAALPTSATARTSGSRPARAAGGAPTAGADARRPALGRPGVARAARHLLRRPPQAPVLLALAVRPRQVPEKLLPRAGAREPRGPADPRWSSARSPARTRRRCTATAADAVYEESGGNPFYLQQLAALARPHGPGAARRHRRAVRGARAARRGARRLLQGAAVAGDPFVPELAAAAAASEEHARSTRSTSCWARPDPHDRRPAPLPLPPPAACGARSTTRAGRLAPRRPRARRRRAAAPAAPWPRAPTTSSATRAKATWTPSPRCGPPAWPPIRARRRARRTGSRPRCGWCPARATPRARLARCSCSARRARSQQTGEFAAGRDALVEALELAPPGFPLRGRMISACATMERLLGRHREARERVERALDALPDRSVPDAVFLIDRARRRRVLRRPTSSRCGSGRARRCAIARTLDDPPRARLVSR